MACCTAVPQDAVAFTQRVSARHKPGACVDAVHSFVTNAGLACRSDVPCMTSARTARICAGHRGSVAATILGVGADVRRATIGPRVTGKTRANAGGIVAANCSCVLWVAVERDGANTACVTRRAGPPRHAAAQTLVAKSIVRHGVCVATAVCGRCACPTASAREPYHVHVAGSRHHKIRGGISADVVRLWIVSRIM